MQRSWEANKLVSCRGQGEGQEGLEGRQRGSAGVGCAPFLDTFSQSAVLAGLSALLLQPLVPTLSFVPSQDARILCPWAPKWAASIRISLW